jgi:hypothetical protein
VWAPVEPGRDTLTAEYDISAVNFPETYGWGTVPQFPARSLEAICQTISRIGVIDAGLHGSNSWRTPYGPVCLHEPYIAQLGFIAQDSDYFRSYQETLDNYRDHAIGTDGRVKSRWAYTCEDAMPGTCDSLGFYEAQWGYLMDSNPDYVTNVAELFDFTGARTWLDGQKVACQRALAYLLGRDRDGDGLVEMRTQSHREARGSDWIDIIWASHENAFVNAKMYNALILWAGCEDVLGDSASASAYRNAAARLKEAFNRPTSAGGFWDERNGWYVHWREPDGSAYGNNLVTFVNFQAIAYGLCDDMARVGAILDQIEAGMRKENLFFWPICMFSYAPGEGLEWQWPFPNYENGDIFLSLGEVGTRAYALYRPSVALRYIRNLVEQYDRDGLAFQRYLRLNQKGAGDDILAGNALGIVGLFRDLFGIQPKHNRLFLDPHLPQDLEGAELVYRHRGVKYDIRYGRAIVVAAARDVTFRCIPPFGIEVGDSSVAFFQGSSDVPSMVLADADSGLGVSVREWVRGRMEWNVLRGRGRDVVRCWVGGLRPGMVYKVSITGGRGHTITAGQSGELSFDLPAGGAGEILCVVEGG